MLFYFLHILLGDPVHCMRRNLIAFIRDTLQFLLLQGYLEALSGNEGLP